MSSEMVCPHCDGGFMFEMAFAGKVVECPHCKGHITMPEADQIDEFVQEPEPEPEPFPQINVRGGGGGRSTTGLSLKGRQGKSVIASGATVKIIKASSAIASRREKTIPIRNITSVEVKKPGPMVVGFIQFSIAGGHARDSSFTLSGGAYDAVKDENSAVFADMKSYHAALRIKKYVENYSEGSSAPVSQQFSVADELMKLKDLMDQGLITPDEFERQKRSHM